MKKVFVFLCAALLCSCSHISLPTNVYVIDIPQENDKQYDNNVQLGNGPVIAIMPISVPAYLNRPQIVMREKGSRILISENHRWAENLDKAISRVLAASLTDRLASVNVVAVPLKLGVHSDYTIQLDISRFEGNLNDYLELDAFWTLQKNGVKVLQSSFYKKVPVGGKYPDLVTAYGTLIYYLAENMAQSFLTLIR